MLINDITKSLPIKLIDINDQVGVLIDKINENFKQIAANNGGPTGPPGEPGRIGCIGRPGPPGKDGKNALSEWVSSISKNCQLEDNFDYNDLIINKFTDKGLLLSNLVVDGNNDIRLQTPGNKEALAANVIAGGSEKNRLKIINSDLDGIGHHIHLANSLAIETDTRFLCRSGFDISLDFLNGNTERLRFAALKNDNVVGHKQLTEFINNKFSIKRTVSSQGISFDANVDSDSSFESTFKLEKISADQTYSLPDRSGFMGVWENSLTNTNTETWDTIFSYDLTAKHIVVDTAKGRKEYEDNIFSFSSESCIKFKRLNSWVLIDYHIGIYRNRTYIVDDLSLHNIQFFINRPSVACFTQGWHNFVVLEDEKYQPAKNTFEGFGIFKVLGTPDNSFGLPLRFMNNPITFSDKGNELYWLSGQVWATVRDADECLLLDIDQTDECVDVTINTTSSTSSTSSTSTTSSTDSTSSTASTASNCLAITGNVYMSKELTTSTSGIVNYNVDENIILNSTSGTGGFDITWTENDVNNCIGINITSNTTTNPYYYSLNWALWNNDSKSIDSSWIWHLGGDNNRLFIKDIYNTIVNGLHKTWNNNSVMSLICTVIDETNQCQANSRLFNITKLPNAPVVKCNDNLFDSIMLGGYSNFTNTSPIVADNFYDSGELATYTNSSAISLNDSLHTQYVEWFNNTQSLSIAQLYGVNNTPNPSAFFDVNDDQIYNYTWYACDAKGCCDTDNPIYSRINTGGKPFLPKISLFANESLLTHTAADSIMYVRCAFKIRSPQNDSLLSIPIKIKFINGYVK